jgi:hypothetical protein
MVAPTPAGVRRRVAIETATITVKASGTVQAAPPTGPVDLGSVAPAVINERRVREPALNRARGS